ncbi:PAAR domain-containing protein [[Curtobacterium] plantarum]|uniref:NAD(+)--protein-arginine ADP-ribosyltransferase n=1 Tax=[Curtobacterium] plantarum TaxID=221276 RepID=A0ABT9T4Z7_9GAMM|nr:PAAR domain-containing protein [[Curtobacterium] plantarum]MDQ0018550.1 putative Zn-binding protein involved in type VI secretion [[Curtobacterium] plantarum]
MAEFNAAREQDEVAHTASKGWMIAGLIGGAILGAAAVVVTGGAALVVVSAAAAGACAAGGVGEVLGSMSWAPRHNTGKLLSGSPNVFTNSRAAIRAHLSKGDCNEHSGSLQLVAEGSDKVFINNFPAARIGDRLTCSAEISGGSANVFIGGGKLQTDDINPEIPGWVNWLMMGIGTAAVAVLASPAIALLGLAGAMGGGYAGNWVGGRLFGEGSDEQKWSMLVGSFVGGAFGGKGGMKFDAWRAVKTGENVEVVPEVVAEPVVPKMPLSEAVGKAQADEWIAAGRANALSNNAVKSAMLTDDQVGALYGYTTNEGYTALNPALRGQTPLTPELEAFAAHAKDGLSKLPPYKGLSYRGINSLPEEVLAKNQPGNIVSDGAFMSTSSNEPFQGNILIKVNGASGRDVAFLSEYPLEAEVLYPPDTQFKVIERIDDGGNITLTYKEFL